MKSWPVQEAEMHFGELVDKCLAEGPQLVTRQGTDAVVMVPAEQWHRLQRAATPTLKELLLSDHARGDLTFPERGRTRGRRLPTLT